MRNDNTFPSTNDKRIRGYRTPSYWFGIYLGRIQGMSSVSFGSEEELLKEYDSVYGDSINVPPLRRVYEDGSEFQLRGI